MTLSGEVYKCSAGERFDSVALAVYGDEAYAAELLNANPALCLLPVFVGGEVLRLPLVERKDSGGDGSYMPAKAPWKE